MQAKWASAGARSENELIAQCADREIELLQPRALALDHALKARLDVVEQHRQLLAPLELSQFATERFWGVVAARLRQPAEVIREAHLHQDRLEIVGGVQDLPEAVGRARIAAVRERAIAPADGERA